MRNPLRKIKKIKIPINAFIQEIKKIIKLVNLKIKY